MSRYPEEERPNKTLGRPEDEEASTSKAGKDCPKLDVFKVEISAMPPTNERFGVREARRVTLITCKTDCVLDLLCPRCEKRHRFTVEIKKLEIREADETQGLAAEESSDDEDAYCPKLMTPNFRIEVASLAPKFDRLRYVEARAIGYMVEKFTTNLDMNCSRCDQLQRFTVFVKFMERKELKKSFTPRKDGKGPIDPRKG